MASTITSDSELEEGSSSNLNVSPLKRGRSSTSHADCDDDDHDHELSDTDTEEIASKRRFNGADIYKTKYQQSWERTWSYIRPVKGNPHAFYCKVCMKSISCAHQGERDISHHAEQQDNTIVLTKTENSIIIRMSCELLKFETPECMSHSFYPNLTHFD